MRPSRPPFALLLVAALLSVTGCSDVPEPAQQRTIILGLDGMDPRLTEQWMAAGELPNFSRLAAMGHYQRLGTTNPPQSPVAWSSFATRSNPGEHGIYDFIRREASDYSPDFSIAYVRPPEDHIDLLDYRIPTSAPVIENRRQGQPFWLDFESDDKRASVLRVPVTFPPDPVHRMLSGMGVPDLLGTQGTYTYYTTRHEAGAGVGRIVTVRARQGVVETSLEGPPHPFRKDGKALEVPLSISRYDHGAVSIALAGHQFVLHKGEWSGWVSVDYEFAGAMGVGGMVRMLLVEGFPHLKLYVSPINLDPAAPAMPMSHPADYSRELVDAIGAYHTLGMPEETSSLNEGKVSDAQYLQMVEHVLQEREAMFFDTLARRDSELVIGVFVQTDRVSHMFWRGLDEQHALHQKVDATGRNAIRWIYGEADRILGRTLDAMGEQDQLIVLSDHGFADFRQAVNLNRWLVDEGYLVLNPGSSESPEHFAEVDWNKTRAYALGFNGIFINQQGREAHGLVAASEVAALKQEIINRMSAAQDPDGGKPLFTRGQDSLQIYQGSAMADAPDIVVGYAPPYRASWETVLGAAPAPLVYENREKWSGDHCVDASHVPGVLFTSFKPAATVENIADVPSLVSGAGQ